ncbi:MAG: hypothetical protein U5L10_03165 [Candidatus Moranbacteria bacterium]|nr:hypothetical protein [Candidatus Moranbacteria bacterium]
MEKQSAGKINSILNRMDSTSGPAEEKMEKETPNLQKRIEKMNDKPIREQMQEAEKLNEQIKFAKELLIEVKKDHNSVNVNSEIVANYLEKMQDEDGLVHSSSLSGPIDAARLGRIILILLEKEKDLQ